MGMMRKVLVPIAPQEEGDLICSFLRGMRQNGTAEAVFANVVDPTGLESPVLAATLDRTRDRLRALVEPVEGAGVSSEVRVTMGAPGVEISHLAAQGEFTGMVVGTHGRSDWAKVFMGSVSSQLLSLVKIPMMLVRFDLLRNVSDPSVLAARFSRTVIMPTDFSAGSMRALLAMLDMHLPKIGQLYLVHVLDGGLSGDALDAAQTAAHVQLDTYVQILKKAGLDAHVVVRQGDPQRTLLEEIDDRRATGVIMGARGLSVMEAAVLGSKSGAVVAQAPCPVIIVP